MFVLRAVEFVHLPKVRAMERKKEGGSGKGSERESQGGEEGGETGREEDQAGKLCQPIRGALRSCRRRSREPGARRSAEASLGLSEDGSSVP